MHRYCLPYKCAIWPVVFPEILKAPPATSRKGRGSWSLQESSHTSQTSWFKLGNLALGAEHPTTDVANDSELIDAAEAQGLGSYVSWESEDPQDEGGRSAAVA